MILGILQRGGERCSPRATELQREGHRCSSGAAQEVGTPITPPAEARRFMVDCFKAVGCKEENANIVADSLLAADCRGHYSHGMNRLEMYIKDVADKGTAPNAICTIDKETIATAVVDGHNGLGAVIGKFSMDLAIEKAKKAGIGLVVAHGSNHYGIAGIYALQAIDKMLIGMSFSNTSPFMVPTRAKEAALGTNPIALGVPGINGDSFVLDFASTTAAVGKIELARRKGIPILEGWALNDDGEIETNSEIAAKVKKLMPLGGAEINSGYKGYGLGMLVEIFCGILSGSSYGPNVRKWGQSKENANLGQAFMAINPHTFTPGCEKRMSDLMNHLRSMDPKDPDKPVLVHGDPERLHMEKVNKDGGLSYVKNQHETCDKLAAEFLVQPMISKENTTF